MEAAAVTAGWSLAIALLTVVVATAWAAGRPETLVPRKVRSAPVPWEIGLVLLAALAGYELVHRSSSDSSSDLLTLAFPLLLLGGVSVLGARLLTSASAGPARWSRRWPFPAYLAARRVAGGAASTRLLVAVVAVATGMAVYGTVLVASTRASLEEKALIANGAPVNASLGKGMGLSCTFATQGETRTPWQFVMGGQAALGVCPGWHPPPDQGDRQVLATVTPAGIDPAVLPADAAMIVSVDVRARPSPYRARLLIVDPITYAHVTGATDIADLISQDPPRYSTRIRGATAGTPRSGPLPQEVSIELAGTLTRVGLTSFDAVPGMGEDGATIVVEASQFLGSAIPQVFGDPRGLVNLLGDSAWSTGDPASLEATLLAIGAPAESVTTTDNLLSRPDFRAQDWSLAYLQILAASAAALAVGALLLNLAERQRSRSLASAMVRRMGATRRTMRASIALELAALLGAGVVLGLVLGIAAGAFVASNVDPLSVAAPPRGVVIPPGLPFVVLAAAVVVGALSALILARVTERADVAGLMRLVD